MNPYDDDVQGKLSSYSLKATQFIRFVDKLTGQIRVEKGEHGCVIPTAYEIPLDGGVREATALGSLEYSIVYNTRTNVRRVEKGPKLLFLEAFDVEEGEKQRCISLKATQYVRCINKKTGKIRIGKSEQGCVVPTAFEVLIDKIRSPQSYCIEML